MDFRKENKRNEVKNRVIKQIYGYFGTCSELMRQCALVGLRTFDYECGDLINPLSHKFVGLGSGRWTVKGATG